MQETVSSGGEATSKSFIGFDLFGAANEDAVVLPNMM